MDEINKDVARLIRNYKGTDALPQFRITYQDGYIRVNHLTYELEHEECGLYPDDIYYDYNGTLKDFKSLRSYIKKAMTHGFLKGTYVEMMEVL